MVGGRVGVGLVVGPLGVHPSQHLVHGAAPAAEPSAHSPSLPEFGRVADRHLEQSRLAEEGAVMRQA